MLESVGELCSMWAVPTLLATSLWALADILLDTCIVEEEEQSKIAEEHPRAVVVEDLPSRPMTRSWKKVCVR